MITNETVTSVLNRRSTRVYAPEQIKDEELETIIQAGLYAPSAHNDQSWHFTVIQSKEIIDLLSAETKAVLGKSGDAYGEKFAKSEKFHVFYNAPTVILVSGRKDALVPEIDCSAAIENMLIAAESINIGTCWIGFVAYLFKSTDGDELRKKLNIPEGYEPFNAVSVGYKKIIQSKAPKRRENTVSYIK